jgi:hypothetical protein
MIHMDMSTLSNPFAVWAELARGLRDRFVAELGEERPTSSEEVVDDLAFVIAHCEHLTSSLRRLQEKDGDAFEAFMRAFERE